MRGQGRERIIGNLGVCIRDACDQRRFTGVWKANEPDIRKKSELEFQTSLLTGLALVGKRRGAPCGRREARVALPAAPAPRGHEFVAGSNEICEQLTFLVVHHGADGHQHDPVAASSTVFALATPVLATSGLYVGMISQLEEGSNGGIRSEDDIAAVASVASVGATLRLVWFPMERDSAVASRPGDSRDPYFVDERHATNFSRKGRRLKARSSTSLW